MLGLLILGTRDCGRSGARGDRWRGRGSRVSTLLGEDVALRVSRPGPTVGARGRGGQRARHGAMGGGTARAAAGGGPGSHGRIGGAGPAWGLLPDPGPSPESHTPLHAEGEAPGACSSAQPAERSESLNGWFTAGLGAQVSSGPAFPAWSMVAFRGKCPTN